MVGFRPRANKAQLNIWFIPSVILGAQGHQLPCVTHISPQLEWEDLVPLACAAYNFIPNEHSEESLFFLIFGRDPELSLNTLLEPEVRYMADDINIFFLRDNEKTYMK